MFFCLNYNVNVNVMFLWRDQDFTSVEEVQHAQEYCRIILAEASPPRLTRHGAIQALQIILWSLWTLAVVGTALWHWRSDIVAQQPVNMLGLVIYSALTGLVGMLVLTLVELWLEPLRFLE